MDQQSKTAYPASRITALALAISFSVVGRLIFQVLPNVQPMTVIIVLLTLYLGLVNGLIVALGSLLLSNLLLGMGPWMIGQALAYFVLVVLTSLLTKRLDSLRMRKYGQLGLASYCFFLGILYGWVISIYMVKVFAMPNFWAYYLRGIPYDFLHGLGNFCFYLILQPLLSPYLAKIRLKVS
ncbi:hypothetical protein [Hutsoniella sourekii]|uniref:hypothetical protein n=1 Tax=Hutsoniella sourekii TaxID=87650 RepID=UPI000482FCF7|nr:hypothetical protein [Hutsoniella sourekii]